MLLKMSQQLSDLRSALLELQKSLLEAEGLGDEDASEVIPTPNHFLQFITRHPWFMWLPQLSQLVIAITETLESQRPPTNASVDALIRQAQELLVISEGEEGFSRRYIEASQLGPNVALAHMNVTKLICLHQSSSVRS